ncbi:MAG: hypothetical protein ACR2KV_04645 [Solirubrobacteraceae bacterium]
MLAGRGPVIRTLTPLLVTSSARPGPPLLPAGSIAIALGAPAL